ncbi:hypothetical protein M406DRAFT_68202 [Cryphonectria parasitica EP155]|uniref:F-box domain-containing protein n=1 Tax=Cryphonectria parasitica (strain ATCC 38755 / EP155) TaxID=660469 RepID=A0A9P4Y3F5_CRYP1|nr:uncharacterized protein M406DRAFT_68202 [Cryphonectria parasitica EP155]KAF3765794.1 hypothetical protein M406DRAFT_68202 [Cryphonectria parasitica EP155]
MDEILRAFDLATTEQRRQILFDILDRLTDDEMDTVAQIHSWRDKRFDILGKCPVEIQLCIVEQMELQDVCTSMRVCRRWRALLTTSTGPVVYKVLLKWFPTLLPPFCEQQGAMQQRAEVLYRALKAWSITTAARYPVRLTTGFKDFVDQQWPAQQFARLNHDKTYVDLSCGNYPYQSVEEGSPSRQDPVSTFYSDGNLAYQVDGGNVGSLQPIIVHQLPTCQRRTFSSPTYNLVKGNPPKLMAVGDQLVIGVSGRTV